MKCSNCKEIWFQLPDPEELHAGQDEHFDEIPEAVKPVPEGSALPAIKKEEKKKERKKANSTVTGAVFAALFFVLVTAGFVFMNSIVVSLYPPSAKIYEMVGIDVTLPGEGLVFDKLYAKTEEQMVRLSGSIINLTRDDLSVPMMEVQLKDAHGEIVGQAMIEPPENHLEAEEVMPFQAALDYQDGSSEVYIRFILGGVDSSSRIEEEAGEDIPAPHADETAHPNAHEEAGESPPHASSPPHQESSH